MSLYADYIREKLGDEIIETEQGFATYRYLNDGKSIYIVDIYIVPEAREIGLASVLADEICRIGKQNGAIELLGSVVPQTKDSTTSLKVLLSYGMELYSSSPELIVLKKTINYK